MAATARRLVVLLLLPLVPLAACGDARTPEAGRSPTADAERAPSCRADQLRVTRAEAGAAMGTVYVNYVVRRVAGPVCSVRGRPTLTPHTAEGVPVPVQVVRDDATGVSGYRRPVVLRGARTATFQVGWSDGWCTAPVHVDGLLVDVGGAVVEAAGLGRSPSCYGEPGGGATPVFVSQSLHPSGLRGRRTG